MRKNVFSARKNEKPIMQSLGIDLLKKSLFNSKNNTPNKFNNNNIKINNNKKDNNNIIYINVKDLKNLGENINEIKKSQKEILSKFEEMNKKEKINDKKKKI